MRNLNIVLPTLVGAGAALALFGCPKTPTPTGPIQHFAKIDDFQPYVQPYSRAYILVPTPIETEVVTEKGTGTVRFKFMYHDEAMDEEAYAFTDTQFLYTGNATDSYEPGIPLAKFPLGVGESWDWAGVYRYTGQDRKAKARVSTSGEKLKTVAGEFDTVRVEVELEIASGAQKPATDRLTFWLAPKRGVVRRESEFGYTREPMPVKESDRSP